MKAGIGNYISDVSSDPKTRAIQLWQFLGGKVLFRLSCLSQGYQVCNTCGNHTKYPKEFDNVFQCYPTAKYSLREYPIHDIVNDGYTYDHNNLKDCHMLVFDCV